MRTLQHLVFASVVLAAGVASPNACARNIRDDISKIGKRKIAHKTMISVEKEREIGKQYAAEIEMRVHLITDPQVSQYVDRVAQTIAQNSDLKTPLEVKVIDSPDPNSFILPGGYIYIDSGLIRMAESEGELAGLIAFGVADIATRHWAATQTKATILQYAMVPLIFTPSTYGAYHSVMQSYMNGVPLAFLKFSRANVAESDYFAVQYLYRAGYDPDSYISLLEKFAKIEDAQKNQPPENLQTHPPARTRIASCRKEIKRILPPRTATRTDDSDFVSMKAILRAASKEEQSH